MTYDVDYFIKKFEALPVDMIVPTEDCSTPEVTCVICLLDDGFSFSKSPEFLALDSIIEVIPIGDGLDHRYPQPTPKQRILAALYDIKNNKGEKK